MSAWPCMIIHWQIISVADMLVTLPTLSTLLLAREIIIRQIAEKPHFSRPLRERGRIWLIEISILKENVDQMNSCISNNISLTS